MKSSISEANHADCGTSSSEMLISSSGSSVPKGKDLTGGCGKNPMESELHRLGIQSNFEGHKAAHNILVELADCVVDFQTDVPYSKSAPTRQPTCLQPMLDSRYSTKTEQPAIDSDMTTASGTFVDVRNGIDRMGGSEGAMEGPSGESMCYQLNNNTWFERDQSSDCSFTSGVVSSDWGRCSIPLWGGRIVGRRQVKSAKGNWGIQGEEYNAFINVFEGGSLLYCNMSFEALLNVRKQLEELGFPCKAVNDGLWLQVGNCLLYNGPLQLSMFLFVFINTSILIVRIYNQLTEF